ncbi:unnamed protein product [Pleuronectes platessa]|uniref:Uncharacterized protein n=1 Tax=Pleuronectes platessa TaxID=8262 RepID=A0A9N7VF86_PLEPL|nr:unnamed protein product [Pleuronectes platessa]
MASVREMPLSAALDMNRGPVGADVSSSHNSSVSCHIQLECSTGMTEGVSDHTTTPPPLASNSLNTTLPHQHASWLTLAPPPSLYNPTVNWSVKTNGEELPASEDAAGAMLSKATSHLSSPALSHTTATPPTHPPSPSSHPRAPATLSAGGERERGWWWGALQGLLCYQRAPALNPEVITAQRVALTMMTRWGRCGEEGRAPQYISVWSGSYSLGCGVDNGAPKGGVLPALARCVKRSSGHGQ